MWTKTRWIIALASVPVIAFTLIGGYLGSVSAGENTYRHLRIFEDVVSLISNNYVEEVDLDEVMQGALRGLAEGLDSDSAYLLEEDVDRLERGEALPEGNVGLTVTRRYYTQVVATRDGSPAAAAGILPGDFVRAIDGEPTRFMSAIEADRRLHGQPGSTVTVSLIRGRTQEPYDITLERNTNADLEVTGRLLDTVDTANEIGIVRIPSFHDDVATQVSDVVTSLTAQGASRLVIDVRNASTGSYPNALDTARLFIDDGTLVILQEQGGTKTPVEASQTGARIEIRMTLLVNYGSSGPAELFVAALSDRERAKTIGQRTAGRVGLQKLVRLPDGTGLWLSYARYLTASEEPIHLYGIQPNIPVPVEAPELGEPLSADDPILDRAVEEMEVDVTVRVETLAAHPS
ncbi:MAG: S41 family peptidase [Vicinamibacterales bacterium]